MRILLIGNFAPPYEEESLQNISLFNKLHEDGHECSVINISENPSGDDRFIDTKSNIGYFFKLIRHSRKKDAIHFLTKGYLRVGLLKLMMSIFVGAFFRIKRIVTFNSELFSILGQMRSPFGGTQTLYTSFFLADKIIFADKDTYDVATMYMKKSNFELIPSFIYIPDDITGSDSLISKKLKDKEKVVLFSNVRHPSFVFEILKEMISNYPIPSNTVIVIALSDKSSSKLKPAIQETGKHIIDSLIFVEPDDISSTFTAYSRANIIIRPLSCDGRTFFESFTISARLTLHSGDYIYFPCGMVLIKEGKTEEECVHLIKSMLSVEPLHLSETEIGDPYKRLIEVYEE